MGLEPMLTSSIRAAKLAREYALNACESLNLEQICVSRDTLDVNKIKGLSHLVT